MAGRSPTHDGALPSDPITDSDDLRGRDDVRVDADEVDAETFETLTGMDDLAPVAVTNHDGEVLLVHLEEDCDWKLPCATATPGDDYGAAAREMVERHTGLEIELDAFEGAWLYDTRLEDGDRTHTRSFVVYSATPANEDAALADVPIDVPAEDEPAGIGWFDELPESAAEAPWNGLFFD